MTFDYGPCPRCGEVEIVKKMHADICKGCRIVRADTNTQVVLKMDLPDREDKS